MPQVNLNNIGSINIHLSHLEYYGLNTKNVRFRFVYMSTLPTPNIKGEFNVIMDVINHLSEIENSGFDTMSIVFDYNFIITFFALLCFPICQWGVNEELNGVRIVMFTSATLETLVSTLKSKVFNFLTHKIFHSIRFN